MKGFTTFILVTGLSLRSLLFAQGGSVEAVRISGGNPQPLVMQKWDSIEVNLDMAVWKAAHLKHITRITVTSGLIKVSYRPLYQQFGVVGFRVQDLGGDIQIIMRDDTAKQEYMFMIPVNRHYTDLQSFGVRSEYRLKPVSAIIRPRECAWSRYCSQNWVSFRGRIAYWQPVNGGLSLHLNPFIPYVYKGYTHNSVVSYNEFENRIFYPRLLPDHNMPVQTTVIPGGFGQIYIH